MKTKPFGTAKPGMQVFITQFSDELPPGSFESRGIMIDVRKTDPNGFDFWVMNGRIEGRYEAGIITYANGTQSIPTGKYFEVLGVSRDEYDFWRMNNSIRDTPESVITENAAGMDRDGNNARSMALRALQRWINPIYPDGINETLDRLACLSQNGTEINWNTPSRVIVKPIDGNAYRAGFDWVPPGEKPRGTGNTRTDAIIDLYQETLSKPGWSAAYAQELGRINVDACAPEIQEKHLRLMEFVTRLMDQEYLNSVLSGNNNESPVKEIKDTPEEYRPNP